MKDNSFDVIVIGAGITGLGLAIEASSWGFGTLLIDRGDVCGETSSNSLRIIHGGLRYLQSLDLRRIRESIDDQAYWMREAPAFIKPLKCITPLSGNGMRRRFTAKLAASFYNILYRRLVQEYPTGHFEASVISRSEVERQCPEVYGLAAQGALVWCDAVLTDLQGFQALLLKRFSDYGGELREGLTAQSIEEVKGNYVVQSLDSSGHQQRHAAKVVFNACGPWAGSIKIPFLRRPFRIMGWCLGFNLVVDAELPGSFAMGVPGARGRDLFFTARGEKTAIGTGYLMVDVLESTVPSVPQPALDEFLAQVHLALPGFKFSLDNLEIERGFLPVAEFVNGEPKPLSRAQILSYPSESGFGGNAPGYFEVLATKYTTFKSLARRAFRMAEKRLKS